MIPGSGCRSHLTNRHWDCWSGVWSARWRCSCTSCWQTPFSPHSHTHTRFCYHTSRTCHQRKTCKITHIPMFTGYVVYPILVFDVNKHISTVKSACKEPAYKELLVIRNWFSFPNIYQGTIVLDVNKCIFTFKSAYKELIYKELLAIRNWFSFPNIYQGTSLLYYILLLSYMYDVTAAQYATTFYTRFFVCALRKWSLSHGTGEIWSNPIKRPFRTKCSLHIIRGIGSGYRRLIGLNCL